MAYADFTLESAESAFGLLSVPGDLFPGLQAVAVPSWATETLERGREAAALVSEKARSEFLVVPILLAARQFASGDFSIFSGQRLDVDPEHGLTGECDYILARTPPLPRLRAPIVTILEAKRGDIELGLGQCVAQMVGARLFNQRAGEAHLPIFGCVTTGDDWQFLRLHENSVIMNRDRFFIVSLGMILGALNAILREPMPTR